MAELLVPCSRNGDLKPICEGWEIQAGIWIRHWEQQEIVTTLTIVSEMDEKVGWEIWEKNSSAWQVPPGSWSREERASHLVCYFCDNNVLTQKRSPMQPPACCPEFPIHKAKTQKIAVTYHVSQNVCTFYSFICTKQLDSCRTESRTSAERSQGNTQAWLKMIGAESCSCSPKGMK